MVDRKLSPETRPPKWRYREWFFCRATFKGYKAQGDILSRVAWMTVFPTIPGWWQQNVFAYMGYCQKVITARAWGQGREQQGLPHEGHGMAGRWEPGFAFTLLTSSSVLRGAQTQGFCWMTRSHDWSPSSCWSSCFLSWLLDSYEFVQLLAHSSSSREQFVSMQEDTETFSESLISPMITRL